MDEDLPSLDALGCKFGTDKSSSEHDYLSFYELFFEKLRHRPIKILEIGVLFGASLRLWEEYFPNAIVIGGDIHPGVKTHVSKRIVTEVIDQSNIEDLVQLGVRHGPFDIVIEDGSHLWEHQITTFRTLFPFLTKEGIYVVEDLHTNFGVLAPQFRGSSSISPMEYLKKLADLRVADDQIDISGEEDPFLRTYGRNVQFVTFYRRACLLRKNRRPSSRRIDAPGAESNDIEEAPLSAARDNDFSGLLTIICHIGEIGDRKSVSGSLKVTGDTDIQGFIIYAGDLSGAELEYRARLANGAWTEWVGSGHFAGTMGRSQGLTGFSARFSGPGRKKYDMELVGLFRGQATAVIAGSEGECASDMVANQLYGMQVVIRSRT